MSVSQIDHSIQMLNPEEIRVFLDEQNHIAIEYKDGTILKGLKVALMFPITDRDSYIQFSDKDNNEIGILRKLKDLDPESQRIVRIELEKSYFIPRITAIKEIESRFGSDVWHVETERGPRTFEVVGKRRNIRYITGDQVVIRDIDGNRYEIPSVEKLDKLSRKLFDQEV